MRIIKHGSKFKPLIQTMCKECGCEFEHEKHEGEYIRTRNNGYSGLKTMDVMKINCPECGARNYYEIENYD